MKASVRAFLFGFFLVFCFVSGAAIMLACYKCVDENCSNLPPVQPDYPGVQAGDWPDAGDVITVEAEDSPAAVASPCGLACKNWERLGCPEANPTASGVSCYRTCVQRASLVRIPSKCWSEAKSVASLRACGGIRCVP